MASQSYRKTYDDILKLYDYAEQLVATVEQVSDPQEQVALIQELVDTLEKYAPDLCEEFVNLADSDGKPTSVKMTRLETGFRQILIAIRNYRQKTGARSRLRLNLRFLRNIADGIVDNLRKHMQHVVAMFLEFLPLGLNRFMQPKEIEEMKKREPQVAQILHTMSLNPS